MIHTPFKFEFTLKSWNFSLIFFRWKERERKYMKNNLCHQIICMKKEHISKKFFGVCLDPSNITRSLHS